MARVLIVGCGCRGRELAAALVRSGHAVRGTTRDRGALEAIDATGAQGVVGDPDRLATLVPELDGVACVCWLMGTAAGEPEAVAALHGPRLRALLEHLVDTPVRGFVYEAAGSVQGAGLEAGAAAVREAAERWRIPIEVVDRDPRDRSSWLGGMTAAVDRLVG